MTAPLSGKVVLVTGAGARVGRAIALALASRGAAIAVHYRTSAAGAADTVAEIEALGGVAADIGADLADPDACRGLILASVRRFGGLDALVLSAATYERTPLETATAADWDRVMAVNLRAPFLLAQAALPHLRAARPGRVVLIGDAQAENPRADWVPHAVSKAALAALGRALAKALAPDVLVNTVVPGPVLPAPDFTPEETARALARVPLRRLGSPDDVARAVSFLLGEAGAFMTGAEVPVDGGRGVG